MKCSNCVGVLSAARELFNEKNNEKFYLTEIEFNGVRFPLVASEFLLDGVEGKVELKMYIRSESRNERLFTFLYAMNIDAVDPSTPDLNKVAIGGQVKSSGGLRTTENVGLQVLPFTVTYASYDGNKSVAHCLGRAKTARQLKGLEEGDVIELEGSLQLKRTTIQVLVKEVLSLTKRN